MLQHVTTDFHWAVQHGWAVQLSMLFLVEILEKIVCDGPFSRPHLNETDNGSFTRGS